MLSLRMQHRTSLVVPLNKLFKPAWRKFFNPGIANVLINWQYPLVFSHRPLQQSHPDSLDYRDKTHVICGNLSISIASYSSAAVTSFRLAAHEPCHETKILRFLPKHGYVILYNKL